MATGIELESQPYGDNNAKAPASSSKGADKTNPKAGVVVDTAELPPYDDRESDHEVVTAGYVAREHKIVETAEDIVNQVLSVEDDPTLNPWTFRVAFL